MMMTIQEMARLLGLTPRALRFYEEKGLVSPRKMEHNGYRVYSESDMWRLQTIAALREAGMPIASIRGMLNGVDRGDPEETLYYLEVQRSALYAEMARIRGMLETTEEAIEQVRSQGELRTERAESLAGEARRMREVRDGWVDRWGFDVRAATHDEEVRARHPGYDEALAGIVEAVAPRPGELGIDIGAGTGTLCGMFSAAGARMSAVDQSREMVRRCRSKHPGVEMRLGNALAVPFADAAFDFVVSSYAVRLLDDFQLDAAMSEMVRVAKPGGRICLADELAPGPERIERCLKAHGFEVKSKRLQYNDLYIIYAARPQRS